MLFLKKAASKIKRQQFDNAIIRLYQALDFSETRKTAFYWLSLIYRYFDRYDEEKNIVNQSLAHFPGWDYMIERFNWHNLLFFDQLIPRPPLYLERNPKFIPKQETLEQLCFVTGSDSNYFEFMVELIESVRNTKHYKDIDVFVLDSGLTDDEKHYLSQNLKVKGISSPSWAVDFDYMHFSPTFKKPRDEIQCYQPIMNLNFAHEYFPDYEYYLLMQPDMWIQSERILDQFISLAERQSFGTIFHDDKVFTYEDVNWPIMADYMLKDIAHSDRITEGGPGCYDLDFMKKRASIFRFIVKKFNFWAPTDEFTTNYTINRTKKNQDNLIKVKVNEDNNVIAWINPYKKKDPYILYSPINYKEINFFVLPKELIQNSSYLMKEKKRLSTSFNLNNHYQTIPQIDDNGKIINHVKASLRYRVYPWDDKEQILQTLNQETLNILR